MLTLPEKTIRETEPHLLLPSTGRIWANQAGYTRSYVHECIFDLIARLKVDSEAKPMRRVLVLVGVAIGVLLAACAEPTQQATVPMTTVRTTTETIAIRSSPTVPP